MLTMIGIEGAIGGADAISKIPAAAVACKSTEKMAPEVSVLSVVLRVMGREAPASAMLLMKFRKKKPVLPHARAFSGRGGGERRY
jgi:hypothetical protein